MAWYEAHYGMFLGRETILTLYAYLVKFAYLACLVKTVKKLPSGTSRHTVLHHR